MSLREAGRRGESQGGSCCKWKQADGPLEKGVGGESCLSCSRPCTSPNPHLGVKRKGAFLMRSRAFTAHIPGGFYQIQKESRRPTSYQRPPPDRCHHFPARDSFRLMQGLATRSCPLPPPPWLNNLSTILSSN